MTEPYTPSLTDRLAQEIRHADGAHHMGAGLLAEALMPFIAQVRAEAWDEGATAASEGYDLPDAAQIHNPYRAKEQSDD